MLDIPTEAAIQFGHRLAEQQATVPITKCVPAAGAAAVPNFHHCTDRHAIFLPVMRRIPGFEIWI